MLKSVRYRSDAKLILGIGLVLCALGCAVYGILLIPAVKGVKFEWEYLAIAAGMALIFVLISLYMLCLSRVWAKREKKQETLQDENLALAVESNCVGCEGAVLIRIPESINCTDAPVQKIKLPKKINMEIVKKVGMIAVPVAAACVVAAALASNAKYAKQAKRRKQFYRWLG